MDLLSTSHRGWISICQQKAHAMTDAATSRSEPVPVLPPDDLARKVTVAHPDGPNMRRVSLGDVGDTYTILVSGEESGGRYCLIDMHIPDGSGPPPHRHDFDESFTVLEGEVEFTVRGQTHRVPTGATVTVPSNAPHLFRNTSGKAARMLCVCVPPGLDEFFMAIGTPVTSRTASVPRPTNEELDEQMKLAGPLAAKCRMEIFAPG
jgi:quercetin dioxygenase-like cupin family protein